MAASASRASPDFKLWDQLGAGKFEVRRGLASFLHTKLLQLHVLHLLCNLRFAHKRMASAECRPLQGASLSPHQPAVVTKTLNTIHTGRLLGTVTQYVCTRTPRPPRCPSTRPSFGTTRRDTPNPKPSSLNPKPYTLKSTLYAPNPKLYTLGVLLVLSAQNLPLGGKYTDEAEAGRRP